MIYLGDFAADTVQVDFSFNTRTAAGAPVALVGGGLAVYKDDATTALVLDAVCDLAAVATGQYNVTVYITQESSPFVAGSDYKVVLSAGTVDGTSVAGTVLAQFSIEHRASAPDAIADAVWDETSTGHTTAGMAGAQVWTAITTAVAAAEDGRDAATDAYNSAFAACARLGVWTGTGINTVLGALRAIAAKAAGLTPTDISSGTTFNNTTDSIEAIRDNLPSEAGIADAVWDEALPGHLGADTTGTALDAAMAGADPATLAAIRAQTDLLGVGTVTVASPVTAAGEINITQGDSYEAGDISWTDSNSLWPTDLDTADAITWYCDTQYEACTYTPGTGLLALGALATTQTLDLPPGARPYWLEATWTAGSRVETIGRGTCNVEAKRP